MGVTLTRHSAGAPGGVVGQSSVDKLLGCIIGNILCFPASAPGALTASTWPASTMASWHSTSYLKYHESVVGLMSQLLE